MISLDEALNLARDAYSGSTSWFDANLRNSLERNLRQFHSKHGPDSKYSSDAYRARARFYRPKTRSMVRSAEATAAEAFFSTADVVSITPGNEKSDAEQASAEVMFELLQYRLTQSNRNAIPWFQTLIGAYQDAQVQGVVISHQSWDSNPARQIDKPSIRLIPRENFRFDPAADWTDPISSSPYLIWLMPMRVRDVKAKMKEGKWLTLSDTQIASASKKWDTTRLLREGNGTDSTDVTTVNAFSIVWVHMNIMVDEESGADMMFYTLGTEHMLTAPGPLSDQYAHCSDGSRPFVLGKVVIETHRTDPNSKVALASQTQNEINEIANQRIDNVKFAMNKRYFVKRNRQVDIRSLTRNTPSSVTLLTDIETDVKVVDTPDVTSSSYQEQDRLNMDFDEISGNMSQSSVQANRKLNETVGGMEILASDANKVQAYDLKTFIETWVEPVLRQLVRLEQCYETDEVILHKAAQRSPIFMRMGLDSITDGLLQSELALSINVGMTATSPTQKINNLLTGINGVKTALADGVLEQQGVDSREVIKEIFGALGHKDGGRFFKFDDATDPRVEQLQQKIQELQQALAAKSPPELVAAQVREIDARIGKADADKVAKIVEAIYSAMQAGEVIAGVPQVAPIADKLMQAAGYQAPNPGGVDPNFPQPVTPAAVDAAASGPMDIPESGNTSPMFPDRPGVGAKAGIEADGPTGGAGVA